LALCGASRITAGEMELQGRHCRFNSPFDATKAGVVLVPEERKTQAIIPDLSVHENLHLGRNHLHRKGPLIDRQTMQKTSRELICRFGIRARALDQPIKTLSGGNQQKVILARCIQSNPTVLILAEPTRGVDVAAKREIHRIILDLAASGTAIVLVSSELEELLALTHRIAVFSGGRMVRILDQADATPIAILSLASPKHKKTASHHNAA
jgi:ribose transport system ATP-binding protein